MSVSSGITACTKDRVAALLETYPSCRDSDIKLYLYYLAVYHELSPLIGKANCLKLMAVMMEAPPSESLRRVRQKLQEGGEYIGENRRARMSEQKRVMFGVRNL